MNIFKFFSAFLFLSFYFSLALFADPSFRNSRKIEIFAIEEGLIIDGLSNEKDWKKAILSNNFTCYPKRNSAKFDTKFKLAYDANYLYLLVELDSFNIKKVPDKENGLIRQYIEFYVLPDLYTKKFIQISINENGKLIKKLIDGVSLNESELNINIDFSFGIIKEGKTIIELKLKLEEIGFPQGKISPFLFNLVRVCPAINEKIEIKNAKGESFPEKKFQTTLKEEKEVSAWSPIGYQSNNFYTFGKINLENIELKIPEVNLHNYLNYAVSFVNSVDVYYKAVNNCQELIPEGAEITHDASLGEGEHIPIAQYPCKIDGYFRLFLKSSLKEYQSLAYQIIDKTYKVYKSTRDFNGRHWLPFCSIVDRKGISHGYDQGPSNTRYNSGRIKYDQSKAPFEVKANQFGDNFGFGLLQLSLLRDKIDESYQKKILEILEGMIEFYSQDHVLNKADGNYFWQTETFKPLEKTNKIINKPQLFLLGQDIIYLYLAAIMFDSQLKNDYIREIKLFFEYYIKERSSLPMRTFENSNWLNKPQWRIEYLDLRMIKVLEVLSPIEQNWANENKLKLTQILSKSYAEHPKVKYSEDGLTTQSDSTLLILCIFAFLKVSDLKDKADNYLYYNFAHNGLNMENNNTIGLNMSTYSIVKYMPYHIWKNNNELGFLIPETISNISTILNRKDELINNEKWCSLEIKEHKRLRGWRAVPDRCFVENTQCEGVWKGNEKQAYLKIWTAGGLENINKYFDPVDTFYRFAFYQFTAPFQVHAEPFPFGEAMTFNMIKTKIIKSNEASIEVNCEIDEVLPIGTPIFAIVDITDIVYLNKSLYSPTNFYPEEIKCEEYNFIFNQTFVAEYEEPKSRIDNSKIIFVSEFNGKNKFSAEIKFNKINKRKLIELNSNE